jgi:hypothetical protein
MKWMKERDLLIAQTMAFVQSVTGKKPDAGMLAGVPEAAKITTTAVDIAAVLTETTIIPEAPKFEALKPEPPKPEPSKPIQIPRAEPQVDFQSEIKARVANFRAHQERFLRERDEYCSATMDKVRAALRERTEPTRPVK